MAARAPVLKFSKRHLPRSPKSDWAETWWEAWQWHSLIELKLDGRHHSDTENQNYFIPISKTATMAAILKFFKRHLLLNAKSDWAETWSEASQWHRDSKLLKSFHSDIKILKFFKRHLLLNPKSDWAETWWEAPQWHRDSKLLKSFCSDIQDGRHGDHLEILQMTSPPIP